MWPQVTEILSGLSSGDLECERKKSVEKEKAGVPPPGSIGKSEPGALTGGNEGRKAASKSAGQNNTLIGLVNKSQGVPLLSKKGAGFKRTKIRWEEMGNWGGYESYSRKRVLGRA